MLTHHVKAHLMAGWMAVRGGRGAFADLKDKTAMVLPGDLSDQTAAAAAARIREIATNQPAHPRLWRDAEGSDTRIWSFEAEIPELMPEFRIEERIAAVEDYQGVTVRDWCLMGNWVVPKQGNLGSGGGMHRDSPFSHQVKCIWYLSDVTTQTGPFQYVPGTHLNLIADRAKYPLGATRFDTVPDPMVEVHATAGSLLVADVRAVHGGKPIETGERLALSLYTYTKDGAKEAMFEAMGMTPA